MVASSGAESHNTPNQNIIEIDNGIEYGIEYLDQQIDQLRSARVHVDRINDAGEGSGRGRHWVAISSRTTDLQSGKTTSFGFFEPGTRHFTLGTSSDNRLNVSQGGLTGPTTYSDKFTYNVTSIRRNK